MTDLTSPLAKFGRAKEHFDALKDSIDRFLESKPYAFSVEPDPEHPHYVVRARIQRTPPSIWGLYVGDFGTNARAALDHLINALSSLPETTRRERKLQFPIFDSRERQGSRAGYVDREDRYLDGVSPSHRAMIEGLQPYYRGSDIGSDPLSLLASLNNTDKHQFVSVVDASTTVFTKLSPGSNIRFGNFRNFGGTVELGDRTISSPFEIRQVNEGRITEDGAIVTKITQSSEGPQMDVQPDPVIEIKFDKGGDRIQGRPVLGTLTLIYDRIEEIIGQFDSLNVSQSTQNHI